MSEYQHCEWQTVDRLLTDGEQEAVSHLSSHITCRPAGRLSPTPGEASSTPRSRFWRAFSMPIFIWPTGEVDG